MSAAQARRRARRVAIDPLAGPPPRRLDGRIPDTLPGRARLVALTFDAGGDDGGVPRIMATLRRLGATGTFS